MRPLWRHCESSCPFHPERKQTIVSHLEEEEEKLEWAVQFCLTENIFSARWKVERLVLISKGKGDPGLASSYRPLSTLDTAGKVYENLIKASLWTAIRAAGVLSSRQYGYRAGLPTVYAIHEVTEAVRGAGYHNHFSCQIVLLVTLDLRNSLNSAKWNDHASVFGKTFRVPGYIMRMVYDYLKDRTLLYETREGQRKISVTTGATQESTLAPDL